MEPKMRKTDTLSADGVLICHPGTDRLTVQANGDFGGGTLHAEVSQVTSGDLGITEAAFQADTSNGYWEALNDPATGVAITFTANGQFALSTSVKSLRLRLAGATNPDLLVAANFYPGV